jgi:soluble lytic murein transglycosylase-like protein
MPRRVLPRSVNDGTMPSAISAQILDRIKNDDPLSARVLLDGIDAQLSPQARAEWRERVAWSFYIGNDPATAYALAQTVAEGAGSWVAEGWWTAGLAAFRLDDCQGASDAFARVAQLADNPELTAAGHYWNARALIRCRRPEAAAAPLRLAAARDETLYGMLAAEQLGMKIPETHADADFTPTDWAGLRDTPAVRAAVALVEIGRDGLADEVLRYQARIGGARQYQPLSRLARDLGLPSTQLWMAYNAPAGAKAEPAARFPTPKWTPVSGWKVDPALVYAHTLQESVFHTDAVSPAGARGLMQIMPAAARDRAPALGVSGSATDLARPEINLAFGQAHLMALRDNSGTQGLLPKVIAAFNAGPAPVSRWNYQVRDGGDPLLWIESLPYWETRGYVNIVLRNYWMYERQAGGPSESRAALAEGLWPTFPGLSGSRAVRLAPDGTPRAR